MTREQIEKIIGPSGNHLENVYFEDQTCKRLQRELDQSLAKRDELIVIAIDAGVTMASIAEVIDKSRQLVSAIYRKTVVKLLTTPPAVVPKTEAELELERYNAAYAKAAQDAQDIDSPKVDPLT